VARYVRGWELYLLHLEGLLPDHRLRRFLFRLHGMRIAQDAWIYSGARVRSPSGIVLGEGSVVGFAAQLDGRGGLTFGRNVNLSSETAFWTADHDPMVPGFDYRSAPIVVEDHVWVSFRATVLKGVTIGRGAVVAAGAVVTSDVPPLAIVAGVPAEVVGWRPDDLDYDLGRPLPVV